MLEPKQGYVRETGKSLYCILQQYNSSVDWASLEVLGKPSGEGACELRTGRSWPREGLENSVSGPGAAKVKVLMQRGAGCVLSGTERSV